MWPEHRIRELTRWEIFKHICPDIVFLEVTVCTLHGKEKIEKIDQDKWLILPKSLQALALTSEEVSQLKGKSVHNSYQRADK